METRGRKLKFKTPADLKAAFDDYFTNTPKMMYTVTGLCLHCNMSRQLLQDYEGREDYRDIVKIAKLKVENSYELSLRAHGRAGDIFALKNFGWSDKQQIDHTTGGKSIDFTPMQFVDTPSPEDDKD